MTEVICASLLPEADSSTSNLCSSLPRGCSCKAKRSLLGKQDRDFLKAGCHVLMPWHSAPQYPCCSLEVTFIFSTVKFDAEAAPGDEVSGFQHARTCSTLPLSALLSYPRGPRSPPLPSLLELGAGGLRGDGGGAAQPRAHLRPCRCLQRCCWGPAIPQLGALWPGFSSGATPCTCRHIFFCQQKSFQNFFSNYVENHISVCMFFAGNVIYSQRDSCLTPPLWLR